MTTTTAPTTSVVRFAEAAGSDRHYRRPGWFTRNVANRAVARLTRMGVSVWGSRILEVRGRRSGQPRRTPVNVLDLDGHRYLVSARGEGEWVRNVRAAGGELDLLLGRRRQPMVATELADTDKVAVLRAYLRRWKAEVGAFFEGVDADSTDPEIAAIANRHPVFVLADRR
ncbi:MAG TPA: nitroreductase family deazaflavin-dependent oxidoreductase [Acidimicrobiales bacterium]